VTHQFHDPALGFALRKPESWEFVPPAWSPVAQMRNSGDPSWSWITANLPFCVARRLHQSTRHAFPTLQVSARALQVPTAAQARALLDMQLGVLNKHYGAFDVEKATHDDSIDGHPALTIRGSFSLNTQVDGEQVPVSVLTRVHVIFAPGRAFSMGMSSSRDADYFVESDFEQIVGSVRIT
jgi:hypothetical protein